MYIKHLLQPSKVLYKSEVLFVIGITHAHTTMPPQNNLRHEGFGVCTLCSFIKHHIKLYFLFKLQARTLFWTYPMPLYFHRCMHRTRTHNARAFISSSFHRHTFSLSLLYIKKPHPPTPPHPRLNSPPGTKKGCSWYPNTAVTELMYRAEPKSVQGGVGRSWGTGAEVTGEAMPHLHLGQEGG